MSTDLDNLSACLIESGLPQTRAATVDFNAGKCGSEGRVEVKSATSCKVAIPTKPNQCHFFVSRKQRYCSLPARKSRHFCGEHAYLDANPLEGEDPRIPCPLNPAHTISKSSLQKHLKRCNARIIETPARKLDINRARCVNEDDAYCPLHERPREDVDILIKKVELAYAAMMHDLGNGIPTLVYNSPILNQQRLAKQNLKHVDQVASLIGHLEHMDALHPKHIFVEFGAGKGELSHYINRALKAKLEDVTTPIPFYLVDRSNFRKKFDAFFPTERVVLDIKDLHLSHVPSLRQLNTSAPDIQPIVGFSKHLCGGATDLALSCLHNYVRDVAFERPGQSAVHSIVIALCCHHKCSVDTYIGDSWLAEFDLSARDITALGQLSGWAVCGMRPKSDASDELLEHEPVIEEKSTSNDHYSGLCHSDREKLGYMAKRILDYGRIKYLQAHEIDAQLVYYVDRGTSLENCALIAKYP